MTDLERAEEAAREWLAYQQHQERDMTVAEVCLRALQAQRAEFDLEYADVLQVARLAIKRAETAEAALAAAVAQERERCAKELDETVAHIADNATALRKWPWMEDEARARELGSMYLKECAASFRALAPPESGVMVPREALRVIEAAKALAPLLEDGWDDQDTPEDQNAGSKACDELVAATKAMLAAGVRVY
jgi:hypothetical protein